MLLISPSTYVAAVLFLLLMGYFYIWAIFDASQRMQEALPSEKFFQLFWIPVFFIVPMLTMKSLAEERRQGTLENLMTTPANALQIVLSKFFGAYIFYLILWALTLCFPLIAWYSMPSAVLEARLLDQATLLGGYSFVALSGMLYIAIGIFASSLTRSQLVAGMLSFSMLFILIIGGQLLMSLPLAEHPWLAWMGESIEYLRTFKHLEDFSRGVIDTRPFVLYISNAFVLLGITTLIIESKA